MRLTSQNQTIGNFFISKDRIFRHLSCSEVTGQQLLQIPALAGIRHQPTLFKAASRTVCFCDISKVVSSSSTMMVILNGR
jgi:hypothetical protein